MNNKCITLLLGDVCVAECQICRRSCGPNNTNVMDESLMLSVIGQAQGDFNTVRFDGGEPLLHYELLKKGLLHAKEAGFNTAVYTNGFWGKWSDDEMEAKIGALPIDALIISTDMYHEKFVPERDVERAAVFAKENKISLYLRIGETMSGEPATSYFQRMGSYKFLSNVTFYPFEKLGRAAELPDGDFCRFIKTENIRCASDIYVRYDGEVFPCAKSTAFSMGNINRLSLLNIIDENSGLLSLLGENNGLQRMAAMAKDQLGMDIPELCVSGCEICRSILGDKDMREKLTDRRQKGVL